MATSDKLNRLKQTKADLKAALIEKGQTPGDVFADYPAKVRAIETGGGGTDVSGVTAGASDVRKGKVFVDSTGAEKEGTQPTRSSADVTLTGGSAGGKVVVEWDGSIDGKDLIVSLEEFGAVVCKVSDRVFSDEEIRSGSITAIPPREGVSYIFEISYILDEIEANVELYNDDYVMLPIGDTGYWVFTKNSGLTIFDIPFDEPGVYVVLSLADVVMRLETQSGDNTGTSDTAIVTVPAGIYDQQVQVEVQTGGEQATPVIEVSNSGLITATAGDKSATKQLTTQSGKTITPGATEQIAVAAGKYVTGDVIVAAVQNTGGGGDGSAYVVNVPVNISARVSVTAEKYYLFMLYNGVRLPRIPESVLASYPYAWIRKNTTSDQYQLVFAAYPWYYSSGTVCCSGGNSVTEPWYNVTISTAETATAWTFNKNATGNFGVDTARPVLWSNHDIPNGSATATDIYFEGTDPVPTE